MIEETGAAFLATIAGSSKEATEKNTTAYIRNWIKALEGNSRLMITAAAALRAVGVVFGTRFEEEETEDAAEQVDGADSIGSPLSEPIESLTCAA